MLSICIPVYNVNITPLLQQLREQIKHSPVLCEIICIDDASEKIYRDINREAAKKGVYVQLPNNIGRAAIRNLFLQYAKYENLLLLDCDSIVLSKDFLLTYIQYINQHNDYSVACGGRVYGAKPRDRKYKLRWLYGTKRESKKRWCSQSKPECFFYDEQFYGQ